MKTKTKKILAFLAAVVLLAGVLLFASAFLGNPVSKLLAKRTAQKHLAEKYAGTDYKITSVDYSFKDGSYYADIESPSSMDTYFSLRMDGWGRLKYDSYEDRVMDGSNTAYRLNDEYRAMADSVLDNPNLPYKIWIAYGDLATGVEQGMEGEDLPALDTETLELDGQYDVRELGRRYGRLVVCIEDDEITQERAAELVLDVKERFDQAGVPFNRMDFSLQYFRPEEGGGPQKPDRIDMNAIPYNEIRQEDILQKVEEWAKKTEEYYQKMDAEKEISAFNQG